MSNHSEMTKRGYNEKDNNRKCIHIISCSVLECAGVSLRTSSFVWGEFYVIAW